MLEAAAARVPRSRRQGTPAIETTAVLLDGKVYELRQWDVVRCAPPVVRAFAAGPDGMDLIAIGGPKPEGRDGEMLDAVWPG